jgi:hypothetical protein
MRPDELPGELSQFGAGDDETDLSDGNCEAHPFMSALEF